MATNEPQEARNPLVHFLDSFLQERNIRWILIAGLAILFGSSVMLVTSHWNEAGPIWKYGIFLGYTALALLIGRALPFRPEKGTAVVQLAIGTAIVVAISEIPFVGIMAMVSAWFLVFGAVLRSRGGQATPGQPSPTVAMAPTA